MPMPEATVDEDNDAMLRKNNIRPTRQSRTVHTVSESLAVQEAPKEALRFCVLAPNAGHHAASDVLTYDICHGSHRLDGRSLLETFCNGFVLNLN